LITNTSPGPRTLLCKPRPPELFYASPGPRTLLCKPTLLNSFMQAQAPELFHASPGPGTLLCKPRLQNSFIKSVKALAAKRVALTKEEKGKRSPGCKMCPGWFCPLAYSLSFGKADITIPHRNKTSAPPFGTNRPISCK
jgi:hypothetical protein